MNAKQLSSLIDELISGDISSDDHDRLQAELKSNPSARRLLRERVDLEAAFRSWAAEADPISSDTHGLKAAGSAQGLPRKAYLLLAIAASIGLLAVGVALRFVLFQPDTEVVERPFDPPSARVSYAGTIGSLKDCAWEHDTKVVAGGRLPLGMLSLTEGIAELKFDSGTNVILEGPCEFSVLSHDSARLAAGNVVVHVTELSDGFALSTPEATIVDEGTEYAVSLTDESTEVHVFDGAVLWEPVNVAAGSTTERIESGEARRYGRSRPHGGARIPLGDRQFVRQIEAEIRGSAGEALIAYDGFENLAGRIQRGRSGFGWVEGWRAMGVGPRRAGEIIDTDNEMVFGIDRSDRRMLRLSAGDAICRQLEQPLLLEPGSVYYVSFLLRRRAGGEMDETEGRYFELALSDETGRRGRRQRNGLGFGIASDGTVFVKHAGVINSAVYGIDVDRHYFCIGKILVTRDDVLTSFRAYSQTEIVDHEEPGAWTAEASNEPMDSPLINVQLTTGAHGEYEIDELKVGTSWLSVVTSEGAD